jgi:hypothetical protein
VLQGGWQGVLAGGLVWGGLRVGPALRVYGRALATEMRLAAQEGTLYSDAGALEPLGRALGRALRGEAASPSGRAVPDEINYGRAGRVVPDEINFGRAGRSVPDEINYGQAGLVVPDEINFGQAGRVVPNELTTGLVRFSPSRLTFQGLEVRAVRDLSHLDEGTLRAMQRRGFAARDINGRRLELHHLNQNSVGPLVEIPAPAHNIGNRVQHPFGNQPGAGLTAAQRAVFNEWRVHYWRARATEELLRRGLLP